MDRIQSTAKSGQIYSILITTAKNVMVINYSYRICCFCDCIKIQKSNFHPYFPFIYFYKIEISRLHFNQIRIQKTAIAIKIVLGHYIWNKSWMPASLCGLLNGFWCVWRGVAVNVRNKIVTSLTLLCYFHICTLNTHISALNRICELYRMISSAKERKRHQMKYRAG